MMKARRGLEAEVAVRDRLQGSGHGLRGGKRFGGRPAHAQLHPRPGGTDRVEPGLGARIKRNLEIDLQSRRQSTRGLIAERTHTEAGDTLGTRWHRAAAYFAHLVRARPQFLAYSVKDLPAALPLAARHLCGMPLLTWTVRSDADRRRAARWADQMIFEGFRP